MQRRGEQRRAAEREPETGPEHPAGEDEQEEHRLDAGGAGAERAQRGVHRGQHAEHRQRLGVDAAVGDLGEHARRATSSSSTPNISGGGVGVAELAGRDDERPAGRRRSRRTTAIAMVRPGRAAGSRRGAIAPRRIGTADESPPSASRPAGWPRPGRRSDTAAAPGSSRPAARTPARRRRPRRSGPSATISPSASTTTRSAAAATNSTSWVAITTAAAVARRARGRCRMSDALGVVVEAPGGFVEQHDRRRGATAGSPAPARAAAPRRGRADGCRRGCRAPAGPAARGRRRPPRRGLAVGLVELGGDRVEVEQVGRRSAAPGRPASGPRRPTSVRVPARRRRRCRPGAGRSPAAPTAARTCPSRCGPSAR